MDPKILDELNKGWKTTCKILLGSEIGDLGDYEKWLTTYIRKLGKNKSHLTGKETVLNFDHYCDSAKFIRFEEMKEKTPEFDINQIKDIDSILSAISGEWEYAGNRAFGASSYVDTSDLAVDSSYVLNSAEVIKSSHVFGSDSISNSKYMFGCKLTPGSQFCVTSYSSATLNRCFEVDASAACSDTYFSYNCKGLIESMFCFNTGGKRYAIGNKVLPPDYYCKMNTTLLGQVRDELIEKKELKLSVFNIGCHKA